MDHDFGNKSTNAASDVPSTAGNDPLPLRMLNEYAYCPRLFHLMHVEGRWADNVYTIEGKEVHRRVDKLDHVLPDPNADDNDAKQDGDATARKPAKDAGDEPPTISRSVSLSSESLGITAKLDLVSTAGDEAVPVETKRGRVPNNPERSWEPERVQLMAQGLLLREHGYHCDHGVLYFAGSRTRIDVPFASELEARTLSLLEQAKQAAMRSTLPPPLEDSPKCHGCSLNGICLPDETLALQEVPAQPTSDGHNSIRRLYPVRDDALPFYVQEHGCIIGKSKNSITVKKEGEELARIPLKDMSQLVLCGNNMLTAQTIHLLCEAGIPIVHYTIGNWFHGITSGISIRNAYDRSAQFKAAEDPKRCLTFARSVVAAKGANQRTMLRRNTTPSPDSTLRDMANLLKRVERTATTQELLGIEGNLASHYFAHFGSMLRPRDFDAMWEFGNRNRRPPRDPVNSLLSFAYALLTKECTVALLAEGLDPWWGLFHQPRHGRPSLALDLMEEFRPLVADSAVITAVNTGMVAAKDFTRSNSGCILKPTGRKAFIRAYEARLDQLVTHPIFDYRCSWRAVIRLQARLFSRWLRGDVPEYRGMVTR